MYCPSICNPGTIFTLKVSEGIQNPAWIPTANTLESIEATTYTSNMLYKIDQKTSGIVANPDLEEGEISAMTLAKVTGFVGESTEFSFTLTTLNFIPEQGYLTVTF